MIEDAPTLEVARLSKSYRRRPILRELELRLLSGEALAVIGPNGAGKSTFLGCITGERVPDSGIVRICGHDPFSAPTAAAEHLGFVPENPFLYGELTVAEMLRFVSEIRGLEPSYSAREVTRLLDLFGLGGTGDLLCRELSQGMGRKAALVTALLHRPRLLVLDEVFNGLDRPSAERLIEELDHRREDGASIVLSSHDLELLAEHCDRGLLLAPSEWTLLEGDEWRDWRRAPSLTLA